MYNALATAGTPAFIVYLLDVSGSMAQMMPENDGIFLRKIDHVNSSLYLLLSAMVSRSMKGAGMISPRYRICLIAYSTQTKELFPDSDIVTIEKWAAAGVPLLQPTDQTDTAGAFKKAKAILEREIPKLPPGSPAPFVCHLTDGVYTFDDPEPVAQEIMQMSTADGPVLVENIYIANNLTNSPVGNVCQWPGVVAESELTNEYAKKLFRMSSPIPRSLQQYMAEQNYAISENAKLLFPATKPQLIEIAFTISGLTSALPSIS